MVQRQSPSRGLGRCQSSLQTLYTYFDCRNDQNLKISAQNDPDSQLICFMVGLSDICAGL